MIDIFYLPIFKKKLKHYRKKNPNIKQDYQNLLDSLKENPTNAILIKDEAYKIRVANTSSNKGKSSGYRVYYFYRNSKNTIVLLYMYSKNEESNLSDDKLDKLINECQILFKNELF
jgi:mRNA-degrading endonuclease RelE of RelBE toxin-antitoxin system